MRGQISQQLPQQPFFEPRIRMRIRDKEPDGPILQHILWRPLDARHLGPNQPLHLLEHPVLALKPDRPVTRTTPSLPIRLNRQPHPRLLRRQRHLPPELPERRQRRVPPQLRIERLKNVRQHRPPVIPNHRQNLIQPVCRSPGQLPSNQRNQTKNRSLRRHI